MSLFDTSIDNAPAYSVSELSGALKKTIESNFSNIRVRGELGRVTLAASGHMYVDLKDDKSVINSIMWKGTVGKLNFRPEEGMEVIATGKLSTYAPRSSYNFIISSIEIAGAGALLAVLEKRKIEYLNKGYFEAANKKPIPFLPKKIGVITSPTGAVIQDIIHRVRDRFPSEILLWPVPVQGTDSAQKIAHAINGFNKLDEGDPLKPDVIIVARGGGSIEDLWGFNEVEVIEAVYQSNIPIISGVGHETDTTLIDYVSDLRAPTPTAAAEKAVPVLSELNTNIDNLRNRLFQSLMRKKIEGKDRMNARLAQLPSSERMIQNFTQGFDFASERFESRFLNGIKNYQTRFSLISSKFSPISLQQNLREKSQRLFYLNDHIRQSMRQQFINRSHELTQLRLNILPNLRHATDRLSSAKKLLEALSYRRILDRGYSVIRDKEGKVLTELSDIRRKKEIIIEQKDGTIGARIKEN